jgi:hypothetical protein
MPPGGHKIVCGVRSLSRVHHVLEHGMFDWLRSLAFVAAGSWTIRGKWTNGLCGRAQGARFLVGMSDGPTSSVGQFVSDRQSVLARWTIREESVCHWMF